MASSSSPRPLEPVADLPSSCSPASHHPLKFITDVGLTVSHAESKVSPCQQADGSPSADVLEPEVTLPEDILWKIHALMPMQDAARAACLSHSFLHSWRCYPKLIFDMRALRKQTKDFINRVDHIMQNHSGVGVEIFKLQTRNDFSVHPSYLDRWLEVALTPGIKEFVLGLPIENEMKYNFPGSLLSRERAHSIQYFHLSSCLFHSVGKVGCLSSLRTVRLHDVGITEEELCLLLSNSFALEHLDLEYCYDIRCLKLSHLLSKLNRLDVYSCKLLQMIECSAPKVSILNYDGPTIPISLGGSLQVKKMQMTSTDVPNLLHYASTKLLSIAPNVETLFLYSLYEKVNTPMVLGKFLHLKYLEIKLFIPTRSPDYDFCSLVSFLDASPNLKMFVLRIEAPTIESGFIPGVKIGEDFSLAGCIRKHRHRKLKSVIINGFRPWKTMIELTRCILGYATSLKHLILDTTNGYHRRKFAKCFPLDKDTVNEARKAVVAIRTYIEGKVPPTVKFKVLEPCNCSKCWVPL
ncbi:F-box/FBD/LRR-repeat protein At3g26920 isoform X2 [Lolium perenne]|uniref:F-box/FBD/LRR-repeat protein At3g26920 isoform X2 n=1 Tax=Lolium perenne TaxID=4522 RepID=UPI003A993CCF